MISGQATVDMAVRATRLGAVDFLEKPPQRERILVSLRNALSRNTLAAENDRLRKQLEKESVLVGHSAPMIRLREEVAPRHLVIPDQVIDRTFRRAGTFFDDLAVHVEFAAPFCGTLRNEAGSVRLIS